MVPYEVVGGKQEYVKIQIGDKQYTPQEISAKVLRKLKESAEAYLGHRVSKAVITVLRTSTTLNAKPPKTLARSLVSK
jgi:molecular chaperone DnaK